MIFDQQFHLIELFEKQEMRSKMEFEDIRKTQDSLSQNLMTVSDSLKQMKDSMKTSLLSCESIQNDHQAILVNLTNKCTSLEESSARLESNVKKLEESALRLETKSKKSDPKLPNEETPSEPLGPLPQNPAATPRRTIPVARRQVPKEKILWAGSSIGTNVNFRKIEKMSGKLIRTRKAYTAVHDNNARYPNSNLKDVVKEELSKDKYTH